MKKETANIWEYKCGNKVNIANFFEIVKTPIAPVSNLHKQWEI